jgi:hypothetical protein
VNRQSVGDGVLTGERGTQSGYGWERTQGIFIRQRNGRAGKTPVGSKGLEMENISGSGLRVLP